MINVKLEPGCYVVAVSGGVDSMVLLDILRKQQGLELLVAHVNHGVRTDADDDEKLVKNYCISHNLEFIVKKLNLGDNFSEDLARKLRYDFLQQCSKKINANAIITAHHQDDLLETAIINIMRGTGWRGLAPFSKKQIIRPLLEFNKDQILSYARQNKIIWHEDSTNNDQKYLRNYVRKTLVPFLNQKSETWQDDLLGYIKNQQELSFAIDNEIATLLQNNKPLSRYWLTMLPNEVAYEIIQGVCRQYISKSLERHLAEQVLLFAKVAKPGKVMLLGKSWQLKADKKQLFFLKS